MHVALMKVSVSYQKLKHRDGDNKARGAQPISLSLLNGQLRCLLLIYPAFTRRDFCFHMKLSSRVCREVKCWKNALIYYEIIIFGEILGKICDFLYFVIFWICEVKIIHEALKSQARSRLLNINLEKRFFIFICVQFWGKRWMCRLWRATMQIKLLIMHEQ